MFLFVLIAWIAGILISFYNGNRKLPLVMLVIGIGLIFAPVGMWAIVGFALMAAILWICNKADSA